MNSTTLTDLIKLVSKLPGLGPRSGRRIVLHAIKNPEKTLLPLIDLLQKTATEIKNCEECGNIDLTSPCSICADPKRDNEQICVVEDVTDLWALERSNIFKGRYHILGGTLSALEGRTPEKLSFDKLEKRVANSNITEVIIATNATLDGQTTGFYIANMLKPHNVKSSRLAHGIPIGGELDYMDEGTLSLALKMRQEF